MSLKKRAIEGIVVAGSLVMMSTIAQAADLDGVQVRNAAVQAETDFATGGTAGVVARLDQLEAEAFGDIEAATAGVNQTGRLLVATAEEAVLRFAMQRPANYLTEIETYLEKALAEALEEEKTA